MKREVSDMSTRVCYPPGTLGGLPAGPLGLLQLLRLPDPGLHSQSPSLQQPWSALSAGRLGATRAPLGSTRWTSGVQAHHSPQDPGGSTGQLRPEVCGVEPALSLPRFPARGGSGGDTVLVLFLPQLLRLS